MPNSCAVFGCKINYNDDHRVPVFKLPTKPDDLRHRWIQVLRRDDLQSFKGVYVCVNQRCSGPDRTAVQTETGPDRRSRSGPEFLFVGPDRSRSGPLGDYG